MRIFFQWHCYEKKLRYVQIHFSSSNSSFEVVDNVLKLLIRGVNKNSLSASSLYFISPKLNLLYFILDCRYYKSLIKHVYQLPPPPALLIIVFVSRLLCTVKWTQIFFVYLSTKYLTVADRFKTLLRSKSKLLFRFN